MCVCVCFVYIVFLEVFFFFFLFGYVESDSFSKVLRFNLVSSCTFYHQKLFFYFNGILFLGFWIGYGFNRKKERGGFSFFT
jgi:hypothetical protein